MSETSGDVTRLLDRWAGGDGSAREQLIPLIYAELRGLAGSYVRRERKGHTLQPTALVHEALIRFAGENPVPAQCRGQLMAMMARTMRHVLIDYARARAADKRGGGATHVVLDEALDRTGRSDSDVLELDDVLKQLARLDPRQADVVQLRVFGGFEVREVAEILGTSPATVKRDWTMARAWLHRELKRRS